MAHLGFIIRIGYGWYARADQGHEVPPASALVQPRRNMARVLKAIVSQASIEEVAALLEIRHVAATDELHRLVQEGRVERNRIGVYRRLPATSVPQFSCRRKRSTSQFAFARLRWTLGT